MRVDVLVCDSVKIGPQAIKVDAWCTSEHCHDCFRAHESVAA
jgi:hypothetical protein